MKEGGFPDHALDSGYTEASFIAVGLQKGKQDGGMGREGSCDVSRSLWEIQTLGTQVCGLGKQSIENAGIFCLLTVAKVSSCLSIQFSQPFRDPTRLS